MKKFNKLASMLMALALIVTMSIGFTGINAEAATGGTGGTVHTVAELPTVSENDYVEGDYYQVGIQVPDSLGSYFMKEYDEDDRPLCQDAGAFTFVDTMTVGQECGGVNCTGDAGYTVTTPSGYWKFADASDYVFIATVKVTVNDADNVVFVPGDKISIVAPLEDEQGRLFKKWEVTDFDDFGTVENFDAESRTIILNTKADRWENIRLTATYEAPQQGGGQGSGNEGNQGNQGTGGTGNEGNQGTGNQGTGNQGTGNEGTGTEGGQAGTQTGGQGTAGTGGTTTGKDTANKAPQTGDNSMSMVWISVALVSVIAGAVLLIKAKRMGRA